MTYHFVTSYSDEQWNVYAKDMLDSCGEYLRLPEANLIPFDHERLKQDKELLRFLATWSDKPFAHGEMADKTYNYRHQAIRFAFKVFAYTLPHNTENLTDHDWLIWLDADTRFTAPVTIEWLREVCPDGYMGSYIGRKDWDHSECGWVAFSMRYHGREFLEKMRLMYTADLLFGLPQWHDSYVFDVVRQSMELKYGSRWFNLAEGIGGNHPWPETKLGEVLVHHKGPAAKKKEFGAIA